MECWSNDKRRALNFMKRKQGLGLYHSDAADQARLAISIQTRQVTTIRYAVKRPEQVQLELCGKSFILTGCMHTFSFQDVLAHRGATQFLVNVLENALFRSSGDDARRMEGKSVRKSFVSCFSWNFPVMEICRGYLLD